MNYYVWIQVIHVMMMAAWFGSALAVMVLWGIRERSDETVVYDHMLSLIRRLESWGSILVPITGVILLTVQPHWLKMGWLHFKITLWVIAIATSHISAAKLKKVLAGDREQVSIFMMLRQIMFLCLIIAIALAYLKPF